MLAFYQEGDAIYSPNGKYSYWISDKWWLKAPTGEASYYVDDKWVYSPNGTPAFYFATKPPS
jgi:hypothetical protein